MILSDILKDVKSVGITGHIRPDGDCTGSVLALYNYIVENMPETDVDLYLEQPGSEFYYLKNIDKIKNTPEDKKYDVFFVLDCSSLDRIEPFISCFNNASKTVCIDHHVSNTGFTDLSKIEPQASSACEVLYGTMDADKISRNVAECIYTGIIHDTGVFKYSCTSKKTMEIAGEMMEKGIDYSDIIDNTFYKKTYVQNQILGRALLESIMVLDQRCIVSVVRLKEMEFFQAKPSDLEGIVSQMRQTKGVEVAMFLHETAPQTFKVSLRSKERVDVSRIAKYFGGGGHVRAAGVTMKGSVHDVINNLTALIEKQLDEKIEQED